MTTITLYDECTRALILTKKIWDETQTNKKRFGYVTATVITALQVFVDEHKDRLATAVRPQSRYQLSHTIREAGEKYAEEQESARNDILGLLYGVDEALGAAFSHLPPTYQAADRALDTLNRLPKEEYDLPSLQLMLARARV